MAWTTPSTVVAGQTLSAAFWNEQVRDNLTELAPFFAAWTTWTPVLRTGGSNVTLGSGSTATGKYLKIGRICFAELYIKFGTSGVSVGAGTMDIEALPVAASGQSESNIPIGSVTARDLTGNTVIGIITSARNFFSDGAGNYVWNQTAPFTWAANDEIRASMTYQCVA